MLLLLLPPQIGLMKDTLFVDLFLWDHKKVNQEEMQTNKCQVFTMKLHEESVISTTNAARRSLVAQSGYDFQ